MNKILLSVIAGGKYIPDGSTATPVDNYATWLSCAGLPDTYGSLANVIADSTAKTTLCNDLNALRYMVRSTSTIMPSVLADSGWVTALDSSTYAVKVPTMTDYTAPSGEVIDSNHYGVYYGWLAFDGNVGTGWNIHSLALPQSVQYQFTSACVLYKMYAKFYNSAYAPTSYKVSYSDNGSSWTDIGTYSNSSDELTKLFADVISMHGYYRFTVLAGSTSGPETDTLQFYGLNLA